MGDGDATGPASPAAGLRPPRRDGSAAPPLGRVQAAWIREAEGRMAACPLPGTFPAALLTWLQRESMGTGFNFHPRVQLSVMLHNNAAWHLRV